jgi:class 3 adenylate cyclase
MLLTALIVSFVVGLVLARSRSIQTARDIRRLARHPAPTFLFADLVGFTAMTEEHGDEAAAGVAARFHAAMAMLTREHGALRVKSLGDGAMICAPDAARALDLAARTVELGRRPDLLPVRVGAHTGPAVAVGNDWYGASVNVAARLAESACANEAVVSHATRMAAGADRGPWPSVFDELQLAGVPRPVAVWRMGAACRAGYTRERGL